MNLAIAMVTCDEYSFLWNKWWYYFKKNFEPDYPIYFLNEKKDVDLPVKQIKVDIPGTSLWTKRLRESIEQIPYDDIFLLLEDLFIVERFTKKEFENIYRTFKTINADALRIKERKSKYTTLHPTLFKANGVPIMKLDSHSKYLIAYTPNIWKRSFLLECIKENENIWQSETVGTNRIKGKDYGIYSYVKPDWYVNTCKKGKLTPEGKKLLNYK